MNDHHKMSCTDETNQERKGRAAVPMCLTEPIVEGAYYERDKGGIWGPAELASYDAPNSGLPMWRGNSVMLYDAYGVPEYGRNRLTRRIYLVPVDPAEVVAALHDMAAMVAKVNAMGGESQNRVARIAIEEAAKLVAETLEVKHG